MTPTLIPSPAMEPMDRRRLAREWATVRHGRALAKWGSVCGCGKGFITVPHSFDPANPGVPIRSDSFPSDFFYTQCPKCAGESARKAGEASLRKVEQAHEDERQRILSMDPDTRAAYEAEQAEKRTRARGFQVYDDDARTWSLEEQRRRGVTLTKDGWVKDTSYGWT